MSLFDPQEIRTQVRAAYERDKASRAYDELQLTLPTRFVDQMLTDAYEKGRADEREKAARRIEALCGHTKYKGCRHCPHDKAAAAVRGES